MADSVTTTTAAATEATSSSNDHTVHEHTTDDHSHQRTICVCIDYSESAAFAVEWTIKEFARKESDLIVLIHVRPEMTPHIPFGMGMGYTDQGGVLTELENQEKLKSHDLLRKLAGNVKDAGFSVRAVALIGDPREEIIRKTEELEADVLIVGSRGLGALKRMVLGSVSSFLTHNSTVPLIIVKEKSKKD